MAKTVNHQKFCSTACCQAHHLDKNRLGTGAAKIQPMQCVGCGSTFKPKTRRHSKYCSRGCAFTSKRRHGKVAQRLAKVKAARELRESKRPLKFTAIWFRACVRCGDQYVAHRPRQKTCSTECWKREPNRVETHCCASCGEEFETTIPAKVYCSDRCRPDRLLKHARARARSAGVAYEPVNALRVFARDGWRCQICGKNTPKERRGSMRSNAPELDHRVPLSKGGAHTYANTQCACRACNGAKGNSTEAGQLPMFNH